MQTPATVSAGAAYASGQGEAEASGGGESESETPSTQRAENKDIFLARLLKEIWGMLFFPCILLLPLSMRLPFPSSSHTCFFLAVCSNTRLPHLSDMHTWSVYYNARLLYASDLHICTVRAFPICQVCSPAPSALFCPSTRIPDPPLLVGSVDPPCSRFLYTKSNPHEESCQATLSALSLYQF